MSYNETSSRRHWNSLYDNRWAIFIICLAIVTFVFDICVDRPLSIGVMYVPIIFMRLLLNSSPPTVVLLSIVVGLDVVGFLFPNISDDVFDSFIDHACVIFVALGAAFVVERLYKQRIQLISSNDQLNKLFTETDTLRNLAEAGRNAKRDFISLISCELRDPASSIINFSELLLASNSGTSIQSRQVEFVSHINQAATELLVAIDKIIEFSDSQGRPDRGNEYRFDLCDVIASVIANHVEAAGKRRIEIKLRADHQPLFVIADPVILSKAVSNILRNAIEASDYDAIIDMSVFINSIGAVVVSIRDYGPGIPDELVPQIGQVFLDNKVARRRNIKGLGIGLALTSRYMNYHQGSMDIFMTSSKGTEMRLSLPANRVIQQIEA